MHSPINLEEEPPAPKLQEQIITTPSKPEEPSPAILQDTDIAPTEVTPAATATNETIIDLKDDSEQCQEVLPRVQDVNVKPHWKMLQLRLMA